jgi:hypothetical protein
MEINYDMILKYLNKKEQFANKKNLIKFSEEFPNNFKELFGDKFYRIGVTQTLNDLNISFFSSFMSLFTEEYITLLENEESIRITMLLEELSKFTSDIGLKKKIKDKESSIYIMELLVNKFQINLLMFDFVDNQIYTVYPSEIMNPWKPFFLFAKHNKTWEPIRNNEKKLFSYNDNTIKKIINHQSIEIKYYEGSIIKKDYFLLDNINEIIKNEFTPNIIEEEPTEESTNNSEKEVNNNSEEAEEKVAHDPAKLNKMTKDEIMKYMKTLNITVTNKKITKKDLIEMIISN